MAIEGFLVGLAIAVPIGLVFHFAWAAVDAAFAQRTVLHDSGYWVRGDSGFQRWLFIRSRKKISYSKRFLLTLGDRQLQAFVRTRRSPIFEISYSEIASISVEKFRSRSLAGIGARVHLKGGGSLCLRAERVVVPAMFASSAVTEELAAELASLVKERAHSA